MNVKRLRDELVCKYQAYVTKKIGPKKAKMTDGFTQYGYLPEACCAAQTIATNYDCGIALAAGGLYLGFIFELVANFPVLTVEMKRRGNGARWMPIDKLNIQGKRVLVFDNDVVTGRTLKRAIQELQRINPASIDLLLVYGHTEVSPERFERWKHFLKPQCTILSSTGPNICLDTMCQIPQGFQKIMNIENDFRRLGDIATYNLLYSRLFPNTIET